MFDKYFFSQISHNQKDKILAIKKFLGNFDLQIDRDIEFFIAGYQSNGKIVCCGAVAGNILKSIAIDKEFQGQGVALKLITELTTAAYELGRFNLFIFTKPENIGAFSFCGFYLIEKVEPWVALLENSPTRFNNYCQNLSKYNVPGNKIGSIVMNANPFTLGHQYLVEQACKQCDWVHLFVVQEEQSEFSFRDRLDMIKAGTRKFANLTIHSGSEYIISNATFPSYFLKNSQQVDQAQIALDLKIFRNYIAPVLGITHRFVGSEPLNTTSKQYNQAMKHWLMSQSSDLRGPALQVVEIERNNVASQPVSASRVRELLHEKNLNSIRKLVPLTTYSYICQNHLQQKIKQTSQISSN